MIIHFSYSRRSPMKRRNIAIEDGNKKLVCVTSFRHIRDNAVKMLSERHQTCMSGGATFKKPQLSSYYFDSIGRAKIYCTSSYFF